MARMASILIPSSDADIHLSVNATTASAAQTLSINRIFVINADQDITITFGKGGTATPTSTNYRIPANQQTTFDMGPANDTLAVFNAAASAANVYIKLLSIS